MVTEFETLTSDSFSEFAGKVPGLVKELAESPIAANQLPGLIGSVVRTECRLWSRGR